MEKDTYNGWTNYATWRVNLEIIDGTRFVHEDIQSSDEPIKLSDLADFLKNVAEEAITEQDTRTGLAVDYAMAFLSDVNWYEIAKYVAEDCSLETI